MKWCLNSHKLGEIIRKMMLCPVVNISSRLASTKERPGHRPPPGRLHDWLLPGQVRQVMMKMAIEIADLSMKNGDVP